MFCLFLQVNGNTVTKTGSATFKKVGVYTPSCTNSEKCVFYETDADYVGIWVWNNSANFTGGVWDSKPTMEFMGNTAAGRKIYKWTYTGTETSMPTQVIFLPGGTESSDLEYKNHGYYIDNVWNHEVEGTGPDPDPDPDPDPTPTEYPYCFFVNTSSWSTVNVWAWPSGQDGAAYVGTAWPGVALSEKVGTYEGHDIYKWTSTKTDEPNGGIIFSTDGGNTKAGGDDLVFENGAYYNADGKITDTSVLEKLKQQTTAIRALRQTGASRYVVYTLQGARVAEVSSVESLKYTMQPGIYIVNGRKVVIR